MQTIITIAVWAAYTLAINVYILSYGYINEVYSKLIYLVSSLTVIYYCIASIYGGFKSPLHKGFILICLGSLGANFVLLSTYYLFGMVDYKWNFCTFNVIQLITAVCVYISGKKRGLFTNDNSA